MLYKTKKPEETKKLAREIARGIIGGNFFRILALKGELGGGKTTFMQGFAKELGVREKILSPTFVLMNKFKINAGEFSFLYHFDLYRIEKKEEVLSLGFKEIISDKKNIVAVEWPEKVKSFLPQKTIDIKFKFIDELTREIKVNFK